MTTAQDFIGGGIAIALVAASGPIVKRLLDSKALSLKGARPDVPENLWAALQPQGIDTSGPWLGAIERTIALVAAWLGEYEIVAGWLAFKVASKWETYANLLQLPDKLEGIDDLAYLRARRSWGSRMMMRFLFGSAANALLGIAACYAGKWVGPLIYSSIVRWCA